MITLSDGVLTVTVPDDLYWADEYGWHPVAQTVERTITGAQIVSVAARIGGRPITLQPQDERSAWMTRATLEQLRAWAGVPGKQLSLSLRGVARDVVFRHHDGAGLEATPLLHFSDVDAADFYLCTLRLMEL